MALSKYTEGDREGSERIRVLYLDNNEADAIAVSSLEIDFGLPVRNIETLNTGGSFFKGSRFGDSDAKCNEKGDQWELHDVDVGKEIIANLSFRSIQSEVDFLIYSWRINAWNPLEKGYLMHDNQFYVLISGFSSYIWPFGLASSLSWTAHYWTKIYFTAAFKYMSSEIQISLLFFLA